MRKGLLSAVVGVLVAVNVFAVPIEQGTRELYVSANANSGEAVSASVRYGYFVIDALQLGGMASAGFASLSSSLSAGAFVEYNFDVGTEAVPFVGVAVTHRTASHTTTVHPDPMNPGAEEQVMTQTTALVGRGTVGIKYFVAENLAISAGVYVDSADGEVFQSGGTPTTSDFGLSVGTRFFF